MRPSSGPLFLELLFLLVLRTLPGDGNEGSVTGSCLCDRVIPSSSPPSLQAMNHFRKHLRAYRDCRVYIRFQLISSDSVHLRNVCGGNNDPWVRELMSCFDRGECGLEHREHLPFPRTTIPEPTEGAPPDMSTSAQMYLPPTQQSTQQFKLPSGTLPLDKELTHLKETTTFKSIVDYSLGIGFKDGENQKLEKEIEGTATEKSAVVAVLSLLAIVFILTGVLLSVLCKRRRDQSLQCSPGLQLHYTPVTTVSNA